MKHLTRILALALALGVGLCGAVWAGDPPPFPDFSPKFGKPPPPGVKRRITVQIESPEPEDDAKAADAPAPERNTPPQLAWFWGALPAGIRVDPALRLSRARARVQAALRDGRLQAPRLEAVQRLAQAHGADILRATVGTHVSPALALAVISVESSGRVDAVSPKGAAGLMQLMPGTAAGLKVDDPTDPVQNIRGGVAHLDALMSEFDDDPVMALAAYNAGAGTVRRAGGVPGNPETRAYIPKVLGAFEVAAALCKTRPELLTDACALNLAR